MTEDRSEVESLIERRSDELYDNIDVHQELESGEEVIDEERDLFISIEDED